MSQLRRRPGATRSALGALGRERAYHNRRVLGTHGHTATKKPKRPSIRGIVGLTVRCQPISHAASCTLKAYGRKTPKDARGSLTARLPHPPPSIQRHRENNNRSEPLHPMFHSAECPYLTSPQQQHTATGTLQIEQDVAILDLFTRTVDKMYNRHEQRRHPVGLHIAARGRKPAQPTRREITSA
jgi:hypothetical protein